MKTIAMGAFVTRCSHRTPLIDVSEPHESVACHVPGAVLAPLGELESRLAEASKDDTVFVICQSRNRSSEGAVPLTGFAVNLMSIAEGTNGWAGRIRELVTGLSTR